MNKLYLSVLSDRNKSVENSRLATSFGALNDSSEMRFFLENCWTADFYAFAWEIESAEMRECAQKYVEYLGIVDKIMVVCLIFIIFLKFQF